MAKIERGGIEYMEKVTLVTTDLDGTLLNEEKQVTDKTRKVVQELKNRGILFGIASGRPVESTLILSKTWGLDQDLSFLIGMNGGTIYDTRRKEKEEYFLLDGETILEITEHFKDMPVIFMTMVGNKRYVNRSTEETRNHAHLFCEEEIEVDYETFMPGKKVNKLILFFDPCYMEAVKERSRTFSSEKYTSFQTAPNLYEYVDPNINKGFGVQKVCEHFGVELKNVVAFGDAQNDKEMLEKVGTGVAMKNASQEIKQIADVVSEYTNEEDALAHFVEDFIHPNSPDRLQEDANLRKK